MFNYDLDDRLNTDTYDSNGNTLTSAGNPTTNVYDFENRLIQQGQITITYDGDGNRVSKTVNGVVTKYLVDDGINPTGYSQVVIEDSTLNGGIETQYVYGFERISDRWSLTPGAWNLSFYGYDGHGSVRFLTDSTGAITDTYDYDAFGNLLRTTGTTPNVYRFAGEQSDPDLNLYYNRARYLSTTEGRFITTDPSEGDLKSARSLHRYLYAGAEPVDLSDPSGEQFGIAEFGAANEIAATLDNITAVHGQAIIDQLRFGGSAGLKSLLLGSVILGGAIAIQGFGSIAREVPLLKAGTPGSVVVNELSAEEAAFAGEIVAFRGGKFVGQVLKDTPGIDGFVDGAPASLKVLSTKNVQTVLDRLKEAEDAAANAGQFGVETFVSAKNIKAQDLLTLQDGRGALVRATIENYPRQGILSSVNILTADGWLRFVP